MANIKLNVISKNNPSNLNIRFYHGRNIDCNAQSNILIDPKLWSNKLQSLKPSADKSFKKHYLEKITKLKNHIIFSFNDDFAEGKAINSNWLKTVVSEFQQRPNDINDYKKYLVPFIKLYIQEAKGRLNVRTGKKISESSIKKYTTTLNRIVDYEEHIGKKLLLNEINLSFHKSYTNYLKIDHSYSNTYINKIISDLKTILKDAKIKGYPVSVEIESPKFTFKKDPSLDTYLNNQEIDILFSLDLSDNDRLSNIRDLFIIGLRTGLRISDLKRIHDFHFGNNMLLITRTEKTGAKVEIPLHPQVKAILNKKNGELPRTVSDQKFNLYVKELCERAGFTDKILGRLMNPETGRKERGYFEKYKLISSHTCRRSFATNLYGKIDDKTIMAITTHKSHKQFLSYIKTTQKEHLEKLAEYWDKEQSLNS
jgi:integrase